MAPDGPVRKPPIGCPRPARLLPAVRPMARSPAAHSTPWPPRTTSATLRLIWPQWQGAGYDGYHAMAVTALAGKGDPEVLEHLPTAIDPSRIALAGLHDWVDDAYAHVAQWGLTAFGPEDLRSSSAPLIDWFRSTGASRLAIHLDVDTIDSNKLPLGLGLIPGGLSAAQTHRLVADLGEAADVVGLTIAEFLPRRLLALSAVLADLPLVNG